MVKPWLSPGGVPEDAPSLGRGDGGCGIEKKVRGDLFLAEQMSEANRPRRGIWQSRSKQFVSFLPSGLINLKSLNGHYYREYEYNSLTKRGSCSIM